MDPIADMMTRISNAQAVHNERVLIPFSKMKQRIAQVLSEAGYVAETEKKTKKAKKAEVDWLEIVLKYEDGQGAISGIRIVSKPSRHLYERAKDIKQVRSGFGVAVMSTPKGIMTSKEARKENVGGEVLFEIW